MKKYIIILSAVLVIAGLIGVDYAKAYITLDTSTLTVQYRVFDFFATQNGGTNYATTTNATSTNIIPYYDTSGRLDNGIAYMGGAKKVTLFFSRGSTGANAGSTTFKIQVTPDGTNWYDYNKLIQNVATTSQNTSVSSITVSATSTTIASMDLVYDNFYGIRCVAVIATDGTALCRAALSY